MTSPRPVTATRSHRHGTQVETHNEPHPDDAVTAWAERIAASLPPFTAAEAAAVGQMAAALDARGGRTGTQRPRAAKPHRVTLTRP